MNFNRIEITGCVDSVRCFCFACINRYANPQSVKVSHTGMGQLWHLYLYEQQRCQMWSRNFTNNQLHVFNKFRIFKVVYCRILFFCFFCHSSIFTKALPDCLWLIRLDIFGIFQLCCSSKVWGTQSYHWSRYYVSVHERKMDILHTIGQRMCYWVNWKIINLKVEISMWRRFGLEIFYLCQMKVKLAESHGLLKDWNIIRCVDSRVSFVVHVYDSNEPKSRGNCICTPID